MPDESWADECRRRDIGAVERDGPRFAAWALVFGAGILIAMTTALVLEAAL